jgi:hypothetical protein
MRGTGSGGLYFLGASIVDDGAAFEDYRRELIALKPRSQPKLHWYDSVPNLRIKAVSAVRGFELEHWAFEHEVLDGDSSERSRRACIEVMMYELVNLGVTQVVFESRGPADDKRDARMIEAMRARKRVQGVRFDHVRGRAEPMLWVPDVVLGAIESDRRGESLYFAEISHQVGIIPTA